jgi:putative ABC transport system permease protein
MVGLRPLDRKLLRDLSAMKGQVFAISLVVAAGVAMFLAYLSNFDSLRLTQATYYDRYRFADVFARATRVPARLHEALAGIPEVAQVETRVIVDVTLDIAELREPATGRLISIPVPRRATLNDLHLSSGRWVEAGRPDEVLVGAAFAEAHGLGPGSSITAIINGRRRQLDIVGVALSPEYVYTVRPGELMPDDTRFGILWMERRALAAAFDMEGGFNDVALKLMPGASEPDVIARVDGLLAPYGGLSAVPRAQQLSHWFLDNELSQLQTMGVTIPIVFLLVAAFLQNVVLTRIVAVQREQIATLKALGYSNVEIASHYVKWSLVITLTGVVIGVAGGAWLGSAMVQLYNQYFEFPDLSYRLEPITLVIAVCISLVAGGLGAAGGVLRAVRLPPAEAMRPEAPPRYRQTLIERLGFARWLAPPSRMILRNLSRQPVRASLSIVGIGFAAAMMVVGMFSLDAIDTLIEVQFHMARRQDVTLSFVEVVSAGALHEVERLPGVLAVEPSRSVPARLRVGNRSRQIGIVGLPERPRLNRVVDASGEAVELPPDGLVLSGKLAEILNVRPMDFVTVEVLEGARPVRRVMVADLVDEYMGIAAYMELSALHKLMREADNLSGAVVEVDPAQADALYRRLKAVPAVAGVAVTQAVLDSFNTTIEQNMNLIVFFNVLFSSVIAIGVVYNAARISLSERSRELASLRVLGFTRGEISAILLGELAILTMVAVPLGLMLGYALAALLVSALNTELYRFPLVVSSRTYAWSAITVLVASILSGLVVRRRLDRLDLVAVLKAPE